MKKLRMGIIGCGEIANGVHITGLLACKNAEITALCDIDPKALRDTQKRLELPDDCLFEDYRDLLRSGLVDAVSICTPNNMHFPIAMDAVACGIPYAVEKPVTLDEKEAELLYQATKEKGLAHMVCFSYRFRAAARYARKLIQEGKLGRIYHVYASYLQSWATKDQPYYWRFEKAQTGSGTLGDLGCHIIDLVRFLTGLEYVSVTASTGTIVKERKALDSDEMRTVDVDDWVHFLTEMTDGVSGVFESTRFAMGRGNYQVVEIYGENGCIVYHFSNEKNWVEVSIGDTYTKNNVLTPLDVSQYGVSQMQSFVDLVNGEGDGLAADAEDGLICQHVCDSVLRSAEEKKQIMI